MKCIHMLGKKNYKWIWIAVDRKGRKYINFVIGSRGTETGKKLWEKIKYKVEKKVMTDYWKVYSEMDDRRR